MLNVVIEKGSLEYWMVQQKKRIFEVLNVATEISDESSALYHYQNFCICPKPHI